MHKILVLLGIHGVLLGFAFALAGWMSLIAPDESESSELRTEAQSARQKSWLQAQLYALRWQRQFVPHHALSAIGMSARWLVASSISALDFSPLLLPSGMI
jgi:hypothetical protein